MAPTAAILAQRAKRISRRLVISYIFDWIFIVAIAAVGGGFNAIHATTKRDFVLQDPSISYPNLPDTVTTTTLICVSLVAPAGITFLVAFLAVGAATAPSGTSQALIWRRKLWEWNTAWMGLALSLASAFMITQGLKDLAGKPRPHTLAVCNPDLNRINEFQVGGLGNGLNSAVPIMVNYRICQEQDPAKLRDTFASWPSGHSSFSWAGLLYLSFFLASKFAVTIPYLSPSTYKQRARIVTTFESYEPLSDGTKGRSDSSSIGTPVHQLPPRNQAAAPPVVLLVIVFVPIGTAAFICVSRWFDYHHHGFDIISGALLGIFTSWFSFRYYHMPIRRGSGWSWGARSRNRAFWLGVGRDSYVGSEGWGTSSDRVQGGQSTQGRHPGEANSMDGEIGAKAGMQTMATDVEAQRVVQPTATIPLTTFEHEHGYENQDRAR